MGVFSVSIPKGWQITSAGDGATLSFYAWDPAQPLRKIFYFGAVGPLYMSVQQKQIDLYYMQNGGYPVGWIEMPVIQPFEAQLFFQQFSAISQTEVARNFIQPCPVLQQFTPISIQPQPSQLNPGQSQLIRALFVENGSVAEGLFQATMIPFMAFMNGPGGGNGYACLVMGISAPKQEFAALEPTLSKALGSYSVNPSYAQDYMMRQKDVFGGIMKAGQTLREASDIITDGWEKRQQIYDVLSEKRSDAILGKERLYDPDTNEVFEFENGFYDQYRLNPGAYRHDNLQPIPDNNYQLWGQTPMDGPSHM